MCLLTPIKRDPFFPPFLLPSILPFLLYFILFLIRETRLSIAIDPAPLQFDDDDMFPSRHNDTLDLDEDDEDDGGQ